MKKICLLAITCLFSFSTHAQLVVDSVGKVEIATYSPPESVLPMIGYSATIRPISNGGLFIKQYDTDEHSSQYGINVELNSHEIFSAGISSSAVGNNSMYTYGIRGCASTTGIPRTPCIGVYGGLSGILPYGCGIYGATSNHPNISYLPNGIYAGYFAGDVCVTGVISGTVLSPTPTITTNEEDMAFLDGDGETSVTDRLLNVGVLQARRLNNNGSMAANKRQEIPTMAEADRGGLTEKQLQDLEEIEEAAKQEPIQTQLSSVSYGLAADQLKEVYPELVYEDAEGNYSINYIEMVPLLVQSIKELSAEVSELRQQLGTQKTAKKTKQQTSAIEKEKGAKPDKKSTTYDLSGRPATNPQRGVYVQDGKKVAIK